MKKYLLSLCLPLLATACSDSVTFSPKKGEHQTYWVRTISRLDNNETRSADAYVDYQVDHITPTVKVTLTPLYVDQPSATAQTSFSTTQQYQRSSPKWALAELYKSGFEFRFDSENAIPAIFHANDQASWHNVVARQDDWASLLMNQLIQTPALNKRIPAKVGEVVVLEQAFLHPVTLRVTQVNDQTVSGVIELQFSPDQRIKRQAYGEITLARKTGWIQKLVFYSEGDRLINGKQRKVAMLTTMLPDEHPQQNVWDLRASSRQMDILGQQNLTSLVRPAFTPLAQDSSAFPVNKGILNYPESGHLQLIVLNDKAHYPYRGAVRLSDIRSYNHQGQPLAPELVEDGMLSATANSAADGEFNLSLHQIVPKGIADFQSLMQSMSYITATASYYADEVIPHTITWKRDQKQSLAIPGLNVQISPVIDREHEYLVEFNYTSDHSLLKFFSGLEGTVEDRAATQLPDWLSSRARIAFSEMSVFPHRRGYLLRLTNQPDKVTFYEYRLTSKPVIAKEMIFVPYKELLKDTDIPVVRQAVLFDGSGTEINAFDPHHLQTAGDSKQSATVTLPIEWARACQLNVYSNDLVNGHPLTWRTEKSDHFSPVRVFHLMTDDGVRRYFYNTAVRSNLVCNRQPYWQDIPFTPSKTHPWFVSLSVLPGLNMNLPVDDFVEQYRFYNHQHQIIALLDKDGTIAIGKNLILKDIVIDNNYLRLGGDIETINKLQMDDRPVHIDWTNRFPPLP